MRLLKIFTEMSIAYFFLYYSLFYDDIIISQGNKNWVLTVIFMSIVSGIVMPSITFISLSFDYKLIKGKRGAVDINDFLLLYSFCVYLVSDLVILYIHKIYFGFKIEFSLGIVFGYLIIVIPSLFLLLVFRASKNLTEKEKTPPN